MSMRRIATLVVLATILGACGDDGPSFDEAELRRTIAEVYDDPTSAEADEIVEVVRGYCDEDDDTRRLARAQALDAGDEHFVEVWDAACPLG